jgi:hypothetical protein
MLRIEAGIDDSAGSIKPPEINFRTSALARVAMHKTSFHQDRDYLLL